MTPTNWTLSLTNLPIENVVKSPNFDLFPQPIQL